MTEPIISSIAAGWIICSIIAASLSLCELIEHWKVAAKKYNIGANIFISVMTFFIHTVLGPLSLGHALYIIIHNQNMD